MNWKSKIAWIAALTASLHIVGAADGVAVQVRLYDYARLSPTARNGAKAEAGAILERAGVRIDWAECAIRPEDAPKDSACDGPMTPLVLQIRILNAAMAKRAGTSRNCLGYAVLSGGFDSIASVFFHRAVDLERGNLVPQQAILGAMIAHEIGHLLLGEASHSPAGLMRASWADGDLKAVAKGRLSFTAEQTRRIVDKVAMRLSKTPEHIAARSAGRE